MLRRSLGLLVMSGVLVAATGCGGGDGGPRGVTANGGTGTGGGPAEMPLTHPSMRTVAYLPNYHGTLGTWQRSFPFQNVNYINLSFADVDAAGTVKYSDVGLSDFVQTAHAKGAKVCVALGGSTTIDTGGPFATVLQDANRPAFVANLLKFVDGYKLDCLDIDLEGPVAVNQFYEPFVTELSAGLKAQGSKELTAAVAGWFSDSITDKALASFDFINVMAYDLYSNLNMPQQTSSLQAAQSAVDAWVARGVPREKVVFGVPFYGFQWPLAGGKGTQVTYADLIHRDPNAATQDQIQTADTITYLNSRMTIQTKAQLAKTYGGVMVWEAGQDASGDQSLLQAIRDAVP